MGAPDPSGTPDLDLPNPARIYDYMLGGAHNFEADRVVAERALAAHPGLRDSALANRAFLSRAAQFCLRQGCRQFLDLGSGIPTAEPLHEIVRRIDPDARVAYVDIEPVAVAISRSLLSGMDGVTITAADLMDPDAVLGAPGVRDLLDPAEPTAVLALSVLHFVPDDAVLAGLLDRYCDAVGPGSMFVASHGSTDVDDPRAAAEMRTMERLTQESAQPATSRDRATLRRLFHRVDPVEPGMVDITEWRPDPEQPADRVIGLHAIVGRITPPDQSR